MTSLDQAMRKAFERHDQPAVAMTSAPAGVSSIEGVKATSATPVASVSRPPGGRVAARELFIDAPEKRLRGAHRPPDRSSNEPRKRLPIGQPLQSQSLISRTIGRESEKDLHVVESSHLPKTVSPAPAIDDATDSFESVISSLLSYELSVAGPGVDAWPINDVLPPLMAAGGGWERQQEEQTGSTSAALRQSFKAAWETDSFRLSPICRKIQSHLPVALHLAVTDLMETVSEERPVVSVVGSGSGAGATTVSIVLACSLAKAGWRVMLIDGAGDAQTPLAEQLGIAIEGGWNRATTDGLDASECCVHSLADGFCVLPMDRAEHTSPTATMRELATLLPRLLGSFDVVLVDCGGHEHELDDIARELVGARIVVNDRRADIEDDSSAHTDSGLHIVENFALLPTS